MSDELRDIQLDPAAGQIESAEALGDRDLAPKEAEELLHLEAAETSGFGGELESFGVEAEAVQLGPCNSVASTQNQPFSAVALLRINKDGRNPRRGTGFFIR